MNPPDLTWSKPRLLKYVAELEKACRGAGADDAFFMMAREAARLKAGEPE